MDAVSAKHLVKEFESKLPAKNLFQRIRPEKKIVRALSDVSLKIKKGEFVGYIGQNGSGKSTTIKILTGVLTPTTGSARCLGYVPWERKDSYTSQIGVVFGQKSLLFWDLAAVESLKLYKDIYGLTNEQFKERLEYFNDILHIEPLFDKRVRKLSLGERMRFEIAAALMHEPKIVFLDEPTIGLDVLAKEEVRKFLKQVNRKEKTTVMLTTHDMGDIEALCNRVILLDKGQIIYDGRLDQLKKKYITNKEIDFEFVKCRSKPILDNILERCKVLNRSAGRIRLSVNTNEEEISAVISDLMKVCDVKDIDVSEPDLSDVVSRIYKEGKV